MRHVAPNGLQGMRLLVLVAAMVLAGCAGTTQEPVTEPAPEPAAVPAGHVLQDVPPPGDLVAPSFDLLGTVAAGGPVYGAGEPSTWVTLDGTLYVAFPGCDRSFYLAGPLLPGEEDCAHGLVFRSHDGSTWERLNRDGDGRYTEEGPAANGDADVAVDAAGNVYASNLGSGIQFHTLWAHNQTWEYMANVVPEGEGADRQWMAAGREGHVIMTWMRTAPERDVEVNVTFDGGRTWHHGGTYGDGIGWLSSVQFSPDGEHAYIAYTQPLSAAPAVIVGGQEFEMRVLHSSDGGLTWEDHATGWTWQTTMSGGHWSGGHMAPSIDVTGDGTVVLAFSIDDDLAPLRPLPYAYQWGASVFVQSSVDNGTTWSQAHRLIPEPTTPVIVTAWNAIMPWVTGGAGDRFAVTYLYNPIFTDNDYVAPVWDVRAMVVDGAASGQWDVVDSVIEEGVHAGGICTRGGGCLLTASDRAFLDFFEGDITPDGRLFVAYPHDLNAQKVIEVRAALSDVVLL